MNNFPNFNFNILKPNNTPNPSIGANNNAMPVKPALVSEDIFTPMFQNNPQQEADKTFLNETMMNNIETLKMDSETLLKYLQSSLKMPETLEKFIKDSNSHTLKILVKNMVDTKILAEFLNQNSSAAVEKILKSISISLKSGITDVGQLKDVLGALMSIQAQTNLNSNALKELLLLYIPLNPMVFDKQVDFTPANEEIKEKIENSALSIIFETINFSNILCCINSVENTLYVELYIGTSFPFEKFSKVLKTVSKEINFRVEIEPKISRKINSAESKKSRNFKVISTGFVPTEVLLLASIIIKTIFKADETFESE